MKLYYLSLALVLIGCARREPAIRIRKMDVHIHHYPLVEDETKEIHRYVTEVKSNE